MVVVRVKRWLPVVLLSTLLLAGVFTPTTVESQPPDACLGCCDECNTQAAALGQQCWPGYFEPYECTLTPFGNGEEQCGISCLYDETKCRLDRVDGGCVLAN